MNTIILIKTGQGEYSDYTEWVEKAYLINKKDFNIDLAYRKFIYEQVKDIPGLDVQLTKTYKGQVYNELTLCYGNASKFQKEIKKALKGKDIYYFIEEVLKLKSVSFTEHYK